MKNQHTYQSVTESTYALLVRSEEKERNLSETAIYMLLILGAVFSVWQVAQQPVNLPVNGLSKTAPIVQTVAADAARV
jgi:hypothetical protein